MSTPAARESRFWRLGLLAMYALIRRMDPLIRAGWRSFGLGNVVELEVAGRQSGRPRRVLLGLLRDGNRWFLGHPNGDVAWTRNLESAGVADLHLRGLPPMPIRAHRLPDGDLRNRAVLATNQHPFPGNLVYRLARPHIRAAGTFFAIEPVEPR